VTANKLRIFSIYCRKRIFTNSSLTSMETS